ncbi:DUF1048 domain-containing protein [Kineococcus esterisolvens]|uniref:DUF1048 domain-containing protein n=1 Tax=unclassified Kineococcus TaxID=2621656 RepID=UPI003D7D788D
MSSFLTKVLGDKKEWKAMEARASALPRDYRVVYDEVKSYLWKFASGDATDIIVLLKGVLELFTASAAQGKSVLDVTGTDVASFCDARLRGTTPHLVTWRTSLNRNIAKRLAE